jgi:tRNA-specific 2-thiouridylase
VIGKNSVSNTLLIGPESALYRRDLQAAAFNWLSIPKPDAPIRAFARTRYHQRAAACMVYPLPGDEVRIVFDEPQRAITPGQAVVLYRENMVLGGGTIREFPNGMSE